MTDDRETVIPVWTLATGDVQVPALAGDGPMTAARLAELRSVLAGLANEPIATLEAHPLPDKLDRSRGIPLDAASPLAEHHARRQAAERITELLEELHAQKLADERNELDGCRDAIEKATAVLLDHGKLGVSLGLDSAVHAISKSLAAADRRLAKWRSALDKLPEGKPVQIGTLNKSFPGIDDHGGKFRTHLELAALAIALKRRVIVLQAVEHAQTDPGNVFANFTRALKADQQRLGTLESGIAAVLERLSALELARTSSLVPVMHIGDVDRLLRAANGLHKLGDGVVVNSPTTDVAIEIARDKDGSLVVFPALPVYA